VLIVEDGHGTPALLQHRDALLEQPAPGVLLLPPFVQGVVPVLADDEDALYRQPAAAQGEGLLDGGADRHAAAGRPFPAEVVGRHLVGVEGDDAQAGAQGIPGRIPGRGQFDGLAGGHLRVIQARVVRLGIGVVAGQQLGHDHVGVRAWPVLSHDAGHPRVRGG